MPLPEELNLLDADLPACPRTLLDMLVLLGDDNAPVAALAAVVERDMALAAAVVRTVNSAMYGLLRRVETVHEAVRFIGTREVAAITFSTALRAAFPATPELQALWDSAAQSGLVMSRSAAALDLDPWRAHTAGLFARCGQAVLMSKYPARYPALLADLLREADTDTLDAATIADAEVQAFGVNHAVYGSALCAAWGLSADVVKFVRKRVESPQAWLGCEAPLRDLLSLGAVVECMLGGADREACLRQVAHGPQVLSAQALENAVRGPWEQLEDRGVVRAPRRARSDPQPLPIPSGSRGASARAGSAA